jgi:hypothetical protein
LVAALAVGACSQRLMPERPAADVESEPADAAGDADGGDTDPAPCWDPATRVLPRAIDLDAPCGGVICLVDCRAGQYVANVTTPQIPDLNADGLADLVLDMAPNPSGTLSLIVFLGRANLFAGSVQSPRIDLAATLPDVEIRLPHGSIAFDGFGDYDGDGHLDIAVSDWSTEEAAIFRGPFADDFSTTSPVLVNLIARDPEVRVPLPGMSASTNVRLGFDFNADGHDDLMVRHWAWAGGSAAEGFLIYGRDLSGASPLELRPTLGEYDVALRTASLAIRMLTACDLDDDGSDDLFAFVPAAGALFVHLGRDAIDSPLDRETTVDATAADLTISGVNERGAYCVAQTNPRRTWVAVWRDANADGGPDFLDYAPAALASFIGQAPLDLASIPTIAGVLGEPGTPQNGQASHWPADVDGDGGLDLAMRPGLAAFRAGIAFGPFAGNAVDPATRRPEVELLAAPLNFLPAGDLDGDGTTELALSHEPSGTPNLEVCVIAGGSPPPDTP